MVTTQLSPDGVPVAQVGADPVLHCDESPTGVVPVGQTPSSDGPTQLSPDGVPVAQVGADPVTTL